MKLSRKSKATTADSQTPAPRPHRKRKPRRGSKQPKFVLLLGDEGTILVYMHGARVMRRLFAPSPQPQHTEAILKLLSANPRVPVSILVDNLDQQYVRQSFPPVSALSLRGLVSRRLERDFQPEDLKGSLPLSRDKTGRREWHFLLIALAKTATTSEWLDLIVELPNELKGIYLAPVEAGSYLGLITDRFANEPPKPWQLLLTHNKVSGFRQVVYNEGKLTFTRVSQSVDDAIPAVIAGNIEQEIISTIEYLRRLGFQDEQGLNIVVIASQDVISVLDLKRFRMGEYLALTPIEIADAFALEQAALSADRYGDVVMACTFIHLQRPVLTFSTPYIRKLTQLYRVRIGLRAASALIALACLGLMASNLFDAWSARQDAQKEEDRQRSLQSKLKEAENSVGSLNQNLAFKTAVVNTYDVFIKDSPEPMDLVTRLAAFVTPAHRLNSFVWERVIPKPDPTKPASAPGSAAPLPQIQATVKYDLTGNFSDAIELNKAADASLDELRALLKDYTIAAEPYPWLSKEQKTLEISFDQRQDPAIAAGKSVVTVTITGPNPPPKKAGTP